MRFFDFSQEISMPEIIGHQYIGGARSAAGTLELRSHDASTGEALPYSFLQATETEVDAAARAAASAYPAFRALPATRRPHWRWRANRIRTSP